MVYQTNIKNAFYRFTVSATIALAGYCVPATAEVGISWQATNDALSREVLERSNVVSDFTNLINNHFISSPEHKFEELTVIISDAPGPQVKRKLNALTLPYGYLPYTIKNHATLEETQEAALDQAINTVEYTLYHLFGHLVAKDNSSDADDIAEAVSSWLMIKAFKNGGEQWFVDAQAFGRASQLLDGPLQDYWHEHSLYKSRQRTINCWILGSAPERYKSLLKPVLEPQERTRRCVNEWNTLNSEVLALLRDNIRTGSTLLAE